MKILYGDWLNLTQSIMWVDSDSARRDVADVDWYCADLIQVIGYQRRLDVKVGWYV